MFWALWRAAQAIGTTARTRSGYDAAHCSACIPPIEPPTTANNFVMPSCSTSIAWARTMSRMVTSGKEMP